jgi:thioredoxin reductase (NADPH)/alkyl hydroperoxide reductase subunit F
MDRLDLVIVGGGPAGCAAAVMASSLGMRSVLIEPKHLCHKLGVIHHTNNVVGFSEGFEIIARAEADVMRAVDCTVVLGQTVSAVRADETRVQVETAGGEVYQAPYVVVATGVRPQRVGEAAWVTGEDGVDFLALWQGTPEQLARSESIVLGVDRPLGTLLRSQPDLDMRLLVLHTKAEQYKAAEVTSDPRVTLLPTQRVDVFRASTGSLHLRVDTDDSERTFTADRVFVNLGVCPVVPAGDLVTDDLGYCPPERQHPRVLVAGDIRSTRYQRIMTAYGSGAEAALRAYYALNNVDG